MSTLEQNSMSLILSLLDSLFAWEDPIIVSNILFFDDSNNSFAIIALSEIIEWVFDPQIMPPAHKVSSIFELPCHPEHTIKAS